MVKKSNLYTRTGDNGTSTLYDSTRISKASDYFEILGTIDEIYVIFGKMLNYIQIEKNRYIYYIEKIYSVFLNEKTELENFEVNIRYLLRSFFEIATQLATPDENIKSIRYINKKKNEDIYNIEQVLNFIDSENDKITNFIIPTGHELITTGHTLRVKIRELERKLVNKYMNNEFKFTETNEQEEDIKILIKYVNRVSDFVYAITRLMDKSYRENRFMEFTEILPKIIRPTKIQEQFFKDL